MNSGQVLLGISYKVNYNQQEVITTSSLALIVFDIIKLVLFFNSLNSSPLKIAQAERIKNTARDLLSGLVNNKDMCNVHPNLLQNTAY